MMQFQYIALNEKGKEQKGGIEALDSREAANILRGNSLFVVSLTEGNNLLESDPFSLGFLLSTLNKMDPRLYMRVGKVHLVMLFRQWALMLRAGHTLLDSLDSVAKLVVNPRLKNVLGVLVQDIQEGSSFSKALDKHKDIFTPFVINLVASGEASGELDKIMQRISDDMERKMEVRREVITSMIYPMIILLVSFAVVAFLMLGVIPKMATMMEGKGIDLPENTRKMIEISDFFQDNLLLISVGLGGSVFAVLASYTTHKGRVVVDRLLLSVPIVGSTIVCSSMAQLGWTFSMLIRSGLTVLDALRITAAVISNQTYSNCLTRAADKVLTGETLSSALNEKVIPKLLRHMAEVGEQTGEIDTVMDEMGRYYQEELRSRIKRMTAMIEPALILFVGISVFSVMSAFFSALFAASTGGR